MPRHARCTSPETPAACSGSKHDPSPRGTSDPGPTWTSGDPTLGTPPARRWPSRPGQMSGFGHPWSGRLPAPASSTTVTVDAERPDPRRSARAPRRRRRIRAIALPPCRDFVVGRVAGAGVSLLALPVAEAPDRSRALHRHATARLRPGHCYAVIGTAASVTCVARRAFESCARKKP